jgi:hypothetical protein
MSDDTRQQFDPRFDPAFQRGFDPATPVAASIPAPRPVDPVAQARVTATPPAPPVQQASPPAVAPDSTDALISSYLDAPETGEADPSAPGRNPFLFALGIVAIVLVVAGIWLFVQSGAAFNSRQVRSQGDYMSLDATIHMAPFIALLGGATAIGVLFVFAARWRKKG